MEFTKRFGLWLLLWTVCCIVPLSGLWRTWVGAEAGMLKTRSIKEIDYDYIGNDENVPQTEELDEVNLGQEEMQVNYDSPEYRRYAQQDELSREVHVKKFEPID